jgi:hypothetical protein
MGRHINCKIDGKWEMVWRYSFGGQTSEMFRIHEELGIGEYYPVCINYVEGKNGISCSYEYLETRKGAQADILILRQKDVPALEEWVEVLSEISKSDQEKWFAGMIEAIHSFMLRHADQDEITFEGEF